MTVKCDLMGNFLSKRTKNSVQSEIKNSSAPMPVMRPQRVEQEPDTAPWYAR